MRQPGPEPAKLPKRSTWCLAIVQRPKSVLMLNPTAALRSPPPGYDPPVESGSSPMDRRSGAPTIGVI